MRGSVGCTKNQNQNQMAYRFTKGSAAPPLPNMESFAPTLLKEGRALPPLTQRTALRYTTLWRVHHSPFSLRAALARLPSLLYKDMV